MLVWRTTYEYRRLRYVERVVELMDGDVAVGSVWNRWGSRGWFWQFADGPRAGGIFYNEVRARRELKAHAKSVRIKAKDMRPQVHT